MTVEGGAGSGSSCSSGAWSFQGGGGRGGSSDSGTVSAVQGTGGGSGPIAGAAGGGFSGIDAAQAAVTVDDARVVLSAGLEQLGRAPLLVVVDDVLSRSQVQAITAAIPPHANVVVLFTCSSDASTAPGSVEEVRNPHGRSCVLPIYGVRRAVNYFAVYCAAYPRALMCVPVCAHRLVFIPIPRSRR